MASHSPSNPRSSKPAPSKPVAQARESAIRECPVLKPSFRADSNRPRSAFTLVELLVVIVILAMLASLVTVAASRAMTAARNAAIKAEIDMLHMAIMNYKNEYGSFPPCYVSAITGTDSASKHVQRLFPRIAASSLVSQVRALPYMNFGSGTFAAASVISTDTAIVAWLYGYNSDPQYPVLSTNGSASFVGGNIVVTGTVSPRSKLYDFDTSRIKNYQYAPSGKSLSPYLYYDATAYAALPYAGGNSTTPGAVRATYSGDPKPFGNTSQPFANPDTFQILCAGRDETFGTDDDLSNFWPGTRKDYQDSLNQ